MSDNGYNKYDDDLKKIFGQRFKTDFVGEYRFTFRLVQNGAHIASYSCPRLHSDLKDNAGGTDHRAVI